MKKEDVEPLSPHAPLPSMITLYRRDLASIPDDIPPLVQEALDIPIKIARSVCLKHPALWPFVMDFVQEGNIQLLKAFESRESSWSDTRFLAYIGRCAKGAVYQYLSRTFDIYVPPTVRHRKVRAGQYDELEWIEHHTSWEALFESITEIPETTMHAAFNKAKRKQVEQLLAHLPPREREAVCLHFGIDGRAYSSTEIADQLGIQQRQANRLVNIAIKRIQHHRIISSQLSLDTAERMQQIYTAWKAQGMPFSIRAFANIAHCHTRRARRFLCERGEIMSS